MKLAYKLICALSIFLAFVPALVLATPFYGNYTLNISTGWVPVQVRANITSYGTSPNGTQTLWLATNETGSWVNYSTTAGRYKSGANYTTSTYVELNMTSATACGRPIGFRIYFNDTNGNENVSTISAITPYPLLNGSSLTYSNFTSFSCDDRFNISFTKGIGPAGWSTFLMNLSYWNGNLTCSFNATAGDILRADNTSSYCYLNLSYSAYTAASTVKIYKWKGLAVLPEVNLPAALTTALVGTIIVVYAVVVKRKSAGWS